MFVQTSCHTLLPLAIFTCHILQLLSNTVWCVNSAMYSVARHYTTSLYRVCCFFSHDLCAAGLGRRHGRLFFINGCRCCCTRLTTSAALWTHYGVSLQPLWRLHWRPVLYQASCHADWCSMGINGYSLSNVILLNEQNLINK